MFCTDYPGGQWLFYFFGKEMVLYYNAITEIKDLHLWEDVGVHEQPEEHGAGEE